VNFDIEKNGKKSRAMAKSWENNGYSDTITVKIVI